MDLNPKINGDKFSKCSPPPDKEHELSLEMNTFYRLSGLNRTKRTSYNMNFIPFKEDLKETRLKNLSHSTNGSLQSILHPFESSVRTKVVLKPKSKLSVNDRYRIMNKNSNYKKETNNLSVKDLELLQNRNNLMLNNLKKNF
ncbi:hypothetical protein BpHYR1_000256 [Brachionus plicatilis]|uniref:Uncharacterized protein n=1 Tax=Brachionus plicatilis TaxID=10195 RepID=A0A3M7R743_BRAPC|nr:hypothetical protein BpHYR1_000256 [Brachionus plicatilis]